MYCTIQQNINFIFKKINKTDELSIFIDYDKIKMTIKYNVNTHTQTYSFYLNFHK